ncbi:low molecular weight protein-tyrosine-phosphatase [Qipengyuania algicida]|uniref:low molecular weight protein-tyrosine-phosphatase n=1 Tax=Qipengyuania algicida TaxID=1836209 RepID=UPI00301C17DB
MSEATPAILFVCLGNICRSPLAEGAFRHEAQLAGLEVEIDSAGTGGWHQGEPPDQRARAAAKAGGVDISNLRARQVRLDDFDRFTHIFAMDEQNLADLKAMAPAGSKAEITLLLDLVSGREGASVSDPYYGGEEMFDYTWEDVSTASRALVEKLTA